jgi:hypothetical protein
MELSRNHPRLTAFIFIPTYTFLREERRITNTNQNNQNYWYKAKYKLQNKKSIIIQRNLNIS